MIIENVIRTCYYAFSKHYINYVCALYVVIYAKWSKEGEASFWCLDTKKTILEVAAPNDFYVYVL